MAEASMAHVVKSNGASGRRHDPAMLSSGFERVDGELYCTESWVTQALLDRVEFRGDIWEPACGRGDMADVLLEHGYRVWATDIAGDSLGWQDADVLDFLAFNDETDCSIVTNPPFGARGTLAVGFIKSALAYTAKHRLMVAMLLRNEFDCASTRRGLFECPSFARKLVLTKRPKWAEEGCHTAGPRHNYAWYVWDHQHRGTATIEYLP